jgi:putative lipoic acid-binding regulatory protein
MKGKKLIIIDFSGIAIAPIAMGAFDPNDEDLVRHGILNSIRMYRQKFKNKYGEVVIVADGGGNWRRKLYPEYKGKRQKNRDESKIDWDQAFKVIGKVLDEIKEHMPYKVIHQWGCEADDAIAVLVHRTQEFGNYEDVMIVSSDKDFKQLLRYGNVRQYSPILKKELKVDDPIQFQKEHILSGDGGDGVPNVMSDDRVFVEERRQNTLTKKRKEALLEDPKALGQEVYRNYLRNKYMIDLIDHKCPQDIVDEIISTYENQDKEDHKKKVMPYLIKNHCRLLVECVEEFFN